MKKKIFLFVLTLLLTLTGFSVSSYAKHRHTPIDILYINSYHEGYKWSDDILKGIKSQLMTCENNVKLDIEYMDTKRIVSKGYIEKIKELYISKFSKANYDIIISSDDIAFNFLVKYGDQIFPDTPIVFCGVNYFEEQVLDGKPMITGVVEGFDIGKTIAKALEFHPDTETIYYINDTTVTGNAIMKEFKKTMAEFEGKINFSELNGKNLKEIEEKVKNLPENSIILFLVYFRDYQQNHFEYYESISRLECQSKVPIYGVWDFHLGHGIVGGMLTSGYLQGARAAKMVLDIIDGKTPSELPIVQEPVNTYEFDYDQLKKFSIPLDKLPQESIIINNKNRDKKQILLLHSYNKGLAWTDDIDIGIIEGFKDEFDNIDITYEYMDIKRNSDPVYIQKIKEILEEKYTNKKFDLIIVADNGAFSFAAHDHNGIFKDTPVVFCGVNYFREDMIKGNKNITGVVETIDIKSTLDAALLLHPNTKNVILINDMTITGRANKKIIDQIIPQYSGRVTFETWENENISYIQQEAKKLGKDEFIILLTYNRDKSFNIFTYEESIQLISEAASVPIYSVWDFYLGEGLTGGMLTSGRTQGKTAAEMGIQILNGKSPHEIPVVKDSPNMLMFDYNMLKHHGIKLSMLPLGSEVINLPFSFKSFYKENFKMFIFLLILLMIILVLFIIISLLLKNVRIRKDAEETERLYAMTDVLTGILNRRACFEYLSDIIEEAIWSDGTFTICFFDINGLKKVNDSFGHLEGDELIKLICRLTEKNLRDTDIFCRLSGDEFLIIFPNADETEAHEVWHSIEQSMSDFNEEGSKPYKVSVSRGFAEYNREKQYRVDELIEIADIEMYKNKFMYKKRKSY